MVVGWDPGGDAVEKRLQELLTPVIQAVVRDSATASPHPWVMPDVARRAMA